MVAEGCGTGCSDKAGSFAVGAANLSRRDRTFGLLPQVYRTHQDFTRTGGIAVLVVKIIITDCMGQNPSRNFPHFKGSECFMCIGRCIILITEE